MPSLTSNRSPSTLTTDSTTDLQSSDPAVAVHRTSHQLVGRVTRRVAALTAALLAALVLMTAPATSANAETSVIGGPGQYLQPGLVNLSSTGYTGQRQLLDYQWCTRWAGATTGGIQSASIYAFRAPAYGAYTQNVSMHIRLDRWSGSAWTVQLWHPTVQNLTARPGTYPQFRAVSFSVPPGYTYRLVHVVTWSVNGVAVGQVHDQVNGDAIARNGTPGLVDNNLGTGAGWCRFYR